MANVDFGNFVPVGEPIGEDAEDAALLRELIEEAQRYINGFDWCGGIQGSYFGAGVGGIFGVVLFGIRTCGEEVDEWLWVVVGDLPPCTWLPMIAPALSEALRRYIEERDRWIKTAREGQPVEALAPVSLLPSRERADELDGRLRFIEDEIVPLLPAEH